MCSFISFDMYNKLKYVELFYNSKSVTKCVGNTFVNNLIN